ncbi:hypothetical protein CG709_09555, partial [Lachnotalea glycerini]
MKKIVAVILSVGMIFSMTACGNSSKETKDSASSNTLTVGFDQDFPPFGYVGDDGEFTGFDIELATECAKRMGKEISLQPNDWDAKVMELETGTNDGNGKGGTKNGGGCLLNTTDAAG